MDNIRHPDPKLEAFLGQINAVLHKRGLWVEPHCVDPKRLVLMDWTRDDGDYVIAEIKPLDL